ncbi:3-hydroxyacyl-ACP dehydratase FabZ [Lyticum sinuosum]|uniref:3-hydroxyacyl-[acyl-carrier-protein] dehydratase FabZ n=1 Tax=Lyticum sinuosum TaxID=1332059 RepID=A0AAE5AHP9_9RICK|nr:3-hydroxyacyl-ACP dehydratase FabZ [Lyticum sinuosum]MDZ5760999.1 3-hydroxyacyl-[acyl-carrier-protein] dehydratase FabZ [Lyticum sinuosum]
MEINEIKNVILNIQDIMELIPHRAPFILIDKVTLVSSIEAIGIKNVTINESFFPGHFPGNPIVPGVIILESIAQVAGILTSYYIKNNSHDLEDDKYDVYFTSVECANFRIPVIPGDRMAIEVKILATRGVLRKFVSCVKVEEKIVANAKFTAAMIKRQRVI